MGAFYAILDEQITRRYTLGWLVERSQRIHREIYERQTEAILAAELGTLRALARSFGGKNAPKIPDLPTWEAVQGQREMEKVQVPGWWAEYERANKGKVKL